MGESTKLKVRGVVWLIEIVDKDTFVKIHGEDCPGITIPSERKIHLQNDVSLENIRHEIFHAYVTESYVDDCELTAHQMEENCAGVFGMFGPTILRQASRIQKTIIS